MEKAAFVILITNFGEPEWPDDVDKESGTFTYYGDQRLPERGLTDTRIGGNRFLEWAFGRTHLQQRQQVPPVLCFEATADANGAPSMRFLGLAAPVAPAGASSEDLVAVWRLQDNRRFQNYRAQFAILDCGVVPWEWLDDLVAGIYSADSQHCPDAWRRWIDKRSAWVESLP